MGDDLSGRRERLVAVVQARTSSRRLPGKVLADIGGYSVLELLARRLMRASELDGVLVATSTDPSDDPIEAEAERLGVRLVRGSLTDVLSRYVLACDATGADAVVRITGDCPFTDPEIVDEIGRLWRVTHADYVTNTLPTRSYPDGFDVEVISRDALRRLDRLSGAVADREHVTAYIGSHLDQFNVAELRLEPNLGDVRVTLDTEDDLRLLRHVLASAGAGATMRTVLEVLGHDPAVTVLRHR